VTYNGRMSELPAAVGAVARGYRALLAQRFGQRLSEVRIFGSYARGDAEEDSDLDVAVVIRDLTEPERTEAIDLAYQAWRLDTSAPVVSPLVWSGAEWADRVGAERRIALDILGEGVGV